MSVSLSMAFVAETQLGEGKFRRLQLTFEELKSLEFRFGTRRPTVFKTIRQYLEILKTFVKKRTYK